MPKKLTLRTPLALRVEYNRVKRMFRTGNPDDLNHLFGAMQALAWAFNDQAMRPSRAFRSNKKR